MSQRLAWRKSDRVRHKDRELPCLHPVDAAHRQPEAVPEEPEQHRQNADDLTSIQHVAIKHLSGQKLPFSSCRNRHIHQTCTTTLDQLRHPCFGDHSRLVGLSCNLLHHLNQSIGDGRDGFGELSDRRDVRPEDTSRLNLVHQPLNNGSTVCTQQNGEFGLWCYVVCCLCTVVCCVCSVV